MRLLQQCNVSGGGCSRTAARSCRECGRQRGMRGRGGGGRWVGAWPTLRALLVAQVAAVLQGRRGRRHGGGAKQPAAADLAAATPDGPAGRRWAPLQAHMPVPHNTWCPTHDVQQSLLGEAAFTCDQNKLSERGRTLIVWFASMIVQ